MPEKRKRWAHLSSILAKKEIHRQDLYNRRLFLRVEQGYYILNPNLKIKINEEWMSLG